MFGGVGWGHRGIRLLVAHRHKRQAWGKSLALFVSGLYDVLALWLKSAHNKTTSTGTGVWAGSDESSLLIAREPFILYHMPNSPTGGVGVTHSVPVCSDSPGSWSTNIGCV